MCGNVTWTVLRGTGMYEDGPKLCCVISLRKRFSAILGRCSASLRLLFVVQCWYAAGLYHSVFGRRAPLCRLSSPVTGWGAESERYIRGPGVAARGRRWCGPCDLPGDGSSRPSARDDLDPDGWPIGADDTMLQRSRTGGFHCV